MTTSSVVWRMARLELSTHEIVVAGFAGGLQALLHIPKASPRAFKLLLPCQYIRFVTHFTFLRVTNTFVGWGSEGKQLVCCVAKKIP